MFTSVCVSWGKPSDLKYSQCIFFWPGYYSLAIRRETESQTNRNTVIVTDDNNGMKDCHVSPIFPKLIYILSKICFNIPNLSQNLTKLHTRCLLRMKAHLVFWILLIAVLSFFPSFLSQWDSYPSSKLSLLN